MFWTAIAIALLLSLPGASVFFAHRNLKKRHTRQQELAGELKKLEVYLERQKQIDILKVDEHQQQLDRESNAFLHACYSLISEDDSSRHDN